jgi:hypothetical protein
MKSNINKAKAIENFISNRLGVFCGAGSGRKGLKTSVKHPSILLKACKNRD